MKKKDEFLESDYLNLKKDLSDTRNELDKIYQESQKNWHLYLESQAEVQNILKRSRVQLEKEIRLANKKLLSDLLPLLDSLESSIKIIRDKDSGLHLLYKMFMKILLKNNISKIKVKVYDKFDPLQHEALLVRPHRIYDNRIAELLQSGYLLNNSIIRYCKVIVFKKNI